jgi:TolB-like protein/DNA-binding SARP family transcriptional activator/Tfp pilus assembly protein PilF
MVKAKALLFFLIAEWSYYERLNHRREYLASLFWPDHSREAGLEIVRQVLYQLRKRLRGEGIEDLLQGDRRQIGINPEQVLFSDLKAVRQGLSDPLMSLPIERIEALPGLVFYEEEGLAEWVEKIRATIQYDVLRVLSQDIDREKERQNWELVEQLGVRYLAQFEEPERIACETMAQASFYQGKSNEAREWLQRADLTSMQIEQWLTEQGRVGQSRDKYASAIRLAVLPLRNLGPESEQDVSYGLLEDLISGLSVFEKLEIAPSLSVLPYTEAKWSAREIASRLEVDYLLYGTIRYQKHFNELSISMQLVEAAAERIVWSQTFKGAQKDLYAIQQQVIRKTLEGLQQKLTLAFQPKPSAIPSPEAYQLYLEGWSIYFRGNPEATREANQCFQKAVQLAPDFHRAHLGLGATYSSMASWWGDLRVRDVEDNFYRAMEKASEDNQLRFEISGLMGWFNMWQWNLSAAERNFQHAILQPSDTSFCYSGYTHCLMMQGRFEEAFEVAGEGMRKNPNHVLHRSMLSEIYLLTGRYEESERICKAVLLQMPEKHSSMTDLIWVLILAGRPEEAISLGEVFLERTGRRLYFVVGRLALAYLAAGDMPNAQRLYREMEQENEKGRKGYPYFMALYQQAAGQTEQALDILEKYLPDQLTDYLWLKVQPEFMPLRGHPRFERLLDRIFGERSPG